MKTNRSTHRLLKTACGVALSGAVLFSASAAFADGDSSAPGSSSRTVASVQAKCDAAIAARLTRLGELESRLTGASNVTADHHTTLESMITTTETNLGTLKTQIDAATTLDALRPLCRSIVVDNRVYVLRTPQVDLTIRLDNGAHRSTELTARAAELQSKINDLKAAGKNTARAEANLAKTNSFIAAAIAADAGQADALIALTPANYNANHAVVSPFRIAARHTDVAELRAAAWAARTAAAIARIR
jgi:hypothetical protein